MPEVVDDTVDAGKSNALEGVKFGAGLALGQLTFGAPGRAVGGLAAAGNIGGTEGNTLAINTIGTSIEQLVAGAGGASGGSQSQGVK